MELAFKIIAVALIAAAGYFYSIEEKDWLFACVVLAACSFFISFRFAIKRRMAARVDEAIAGDEDSTDR